MKKVIITIGLSCIAMMFLNGCVEDQKASEIRAENRQNITKINLGMTRAEVVQIMGDKTAEISFGKNTITFTNPYKSEVREVKGFTYEVLYYYTFHDQYDYPFKQFEILDRELTPITFQDGKVIGLDSEFLAKLSSGN
ncbi:MAG: DUF3192 domain-containing protein [Phycisphaerae bacterium]|jgi:hypothetical protein|nr:MAG: hypothetical protein A2Y13_11920 [Planctomycetes bacterium GWC2_45_44]HBG78127.1 hypothetical protein [Phycisphaerales bacterium]HBR19076.1 hypothetical protein [Phycisphaerales bacterium]